MADFCKQCSIHHFGEDFGELKNSEPLEPDHFWLVLCEGCGVIQVDSDGACVSPDCLENGHKPKVKKPKKEIPQASEDDIDF